MDSNKLSLMVRTQLQEGEAARQDLQLIRRLIIVCSGRTDQSAQQMLIEAAWQGAGWRERATAWVEGRVS